MTRPGMPDGVNSDTLAWRCAAHTFDFSRRPLIMGILNVTPDSFSDGDRYLDPEKAVAHTRRLIADGADIIDIGGESTRPGAAAVTAEEELDRVLPVIRALAADPGERPVAISIDTTKASVAEASMDAGASIINDVSAMTADAGMVSVARETGAGVVLMHMQGTPRTMQRRPEYERALEEISGYLEQRVDDLVRAGIRDDAIGIDPGIGFGKELDHNLELLAGIARLTALARPVVIGLSRKSMIGKLTGRDTDERLAGSLALLSYCVMRGAHVMRVHDVRESVDAVTTLRAVQEKEFAVEHADA